MSFLVKDVHSLEKNDGHEFVFTRAHANTTYYGIYIYTCFGGAAGVHVLISNYCNSPSEERGDSDSSSCGDFFFGIITCYYAVLDLTPLGL